MTAAIDITTEQRKTLLVLLRRFIPGVAVWAYGSRVKWTARPNSDLDLVAFTTLSQRQRISELKEALEESNIPFLVDLHVWDEVPEKFRGNIEKEYVVLQDGRQPEGLSMAGNMRETIYGAFASDFFEDRLVNLCDPNAGIQTGPFGSQLHKEDYVQVGTPIITVEHLSENRIVHEDVPRVSDADRDRLSKYSLRTGDIVFSRVGSVDRRAIVRPAEDGWLFSGRCLRVRPNPDKIVAGFLSYFFGLPAFKEHIRAIAVGATMPSLNTSILSNVIVPYPRDVREQRAIAHILGTLDDMIELNRRMNETLEAMARALFKSWFVDFDPVRAKAEGHDTGLPKHIADMFPDFFEDSELGEIPTGWLVGRFGDLAEHLRGQENPLSSPADLFYHFSLPAFDAGQSPKIDYGESIKSLKLRVPADVILLSKLNPEIERVWMVDVRPGERAVCSTEFLVLRARAPFARSYIYCLMRSPLFRQQIEGLVTGTSKSHQRAQVDSILNLAVVVPPSLIATAFERAATDLLARTLECRRESRTLAALRDTLLPKLISGEMRVKDTERNVQDATT